jgi:hypothetical protein
MFDTNHSMYYRIDKYYKYNRCCKIDMCHILYRKCLLS